MMVGNSLKSDVVPAIAAGAYGVHVPHELTWVLEHEEAPEDNPRFRRIADLGKLPPLLGQMLEGPCRLWHIRAPHPRGHEIVTARPIVSTDRRPAAGRWRSPPATPGPQGRAHHQQRHLRHHRQDAGADLATSRRTRSAPRSPARPSSTPAADGNGFVTYNADGTFSFQDDVKGGGTASGRPTARSSARPGARPRRMRRVQEHRRRLFRRQVAAGGDEDLRPP